MAIRAGEGFGFSQKLNIMTAPATTATAPRMTFKVNVSMLRFMRKEKKIVNNGLPAIRGATMLRGLMLRAT